MRTSIITVCKNAEVSIRKTMDSVLTQTYRDIEYIIVDGASIDGTLDVIKEYAGKYSIKWISEPDSGIYAAMNKGIRMSTGDIVAFLNAGDIYVSEEIIGHVMNDIDIAASLIFAGNMITVGPDGTASHIYNNQKMIFDSKAMFRRGLAHPATFYKRALFDRIGLYDETYKIAGDLDLHMRAISENIEISKIDRCVALFLQGGMSCSDEFKALRIEENEKIRIRYLPVEDSPSDPHQNNTFVSVVKRKIYALLKK